MPRRHCVSVSAFVIVLLALGALLWVSIYDVVGTEHVAVHSDNCCSTTVLPPSTINPDCGDLNQPSNCPANGVPAIPACTTKCTHGKARPKIESNNGTNTCSSRFNNTKLTCSNQHTWSVSKTRVSPHQMPASALNQQGCGASPSLQYTVLSVENNPGVYSLAGGQVHLEISNPGDCDSQIVSVLVSLEQQQQTGDGGADTHTVWAVSGLENAALMQACGAGMDASPPAHICDKRCDVEVDYLPGHVTLSNSLQVPVPLHHVRVPSGSSCANGNTFGVDVDYAFELPDAIFAQPANATYHIRVRVTLDSCCENSNACGIDYDCDGVRESVRTLQIESPDFVFQMNDDCTERCTGVGVMDTLSFFASVNGSFPSPLPTVASQPLLPVPGVAPVIITNTSMLCCDDIRAALAQDPSRTDYDPQAALEVRIVNQACLNPPPALPTTCILENGASALGACSSVLSTFRCAAIVDCEVSPWDIVTTAYCNLSLVLFNSTRTVVVAPSNGGLPCPYLEREQTIPLTYAQWTAWSACDNSAQPPARNRTRDSLIYGPCQQVQYLESTVGQWSAWSPCDGSNTVRTRQTNVGCDDALLESEYAPCQIIDCQLTAWTEWSSSSSSSSPTEPCSTGSSPSPCRVNEERSRLVLVHPENGGLPCGTLEEQRSSPCTTGCNYDANDVGVCEEYGACQSGTCLRNHTCSTAPIDPDHCLSGQVETCPPYQEVQFAPCPSGCVYGEWGAWTPITSCIYAEEIDDCVIDERRLRTLAYACPLGTAAACTELSERRFPLCTTCTLPEPTPTPTPLPVPTPTPTPLPAPTPSLVPFQGCTANDECANVNKCQVRECFLGQCVIMVDTICIPPNPCVDRSFCDPLTGGCVHIPKNCSDGNACTVDACTTATGVCTHTALPMPDPLTSCETVTCNPLTGAFSSAPKLCFPGTTCDPSDPLGRCRIPTCSSATDCNYMTTYLNNQPNLCRPPTCNSFGECVLETVLCFGGLCNPATGFCESAEPCPLTVCSADAPLINNFTCTCYSDPALCVNTSCIKAVYNTSTGWCHRTNKSCDDNNVCTIDSATCVEGVGCTHTPITCPFRNCTIEECHPILGCQETPVVCADDGNPCTIDYCNLETNSCIHRPKCANKDLCITGITCSLNGTCSSGTRINGCCTTDSDCPIPETCNKTGSTNSTGRCTIPIVVTDGECLALPCKNLTDCASFGPDFVCRDGYCTIPQAPYYCDDNDICTSGTTCRGGFCIGGSSCRTADLNFPKCHQATCTPYGCVSTLDDMICDDGDKNTFDYCSPGECSSGDAMGCHHCAYDIRTGDVLNLVDCYCS